MPSQKHVPPSGSTKPHRAQFFFLGLGFLAATAGAAAAVDGSDTRFLVHTFDRSGESCVLIESMDGENGTLQARPSACDELRGSTIFPLSAGLAGQTVSAAEYHVYFKDSLIPAWTALPPESRTLAAPLVALALETARLEGYGARNFLRFDSATARAPDSQGELSLTNYRELLALIHGTSTTYLKASAGEGVALPRLSSVPANPVAGQIWYDEKAKTLGFSDGIDVHYVPPVPKCVQSVTAGSGLTGGKITRSGTIALEKFGTPGTYYRVTTDVHGRVKTGKSALDESDLPTIVTPGKVSGSAVISGTIGGSTSVNTAGDIKTTGAVSSTSVSALTLSGQSLGLFTSGNARHVTVGVPAAMPANYNLTLPASLPAVAGQVLAADSAGNLSWVTMNPGTTSGGTPPTVVSGVAPIVVTGTAQAPVVSVAGATTSSVGVVQLAGLGAATPGSVVQANDPRLSDGRTPGGAAGGDLSGQYPAPTVAKIEGVAVSAQTPADDQTFKYSGGSNSWVPGYVGVSDLRGSTGVSQFPVAPCAPSQTLIYNSVSDQLMCVNIAISYTAVSGLGDAATKNVGTGGGTVAAGDDPRIGNATRIQGRAVAAVEPVGAQVLAWNASANSWGPQNYPAAPVSSVAGRVGDVVLLYSDIVGLGSAATYDAPGSGDAAATEVVLGNDSRLTNGRPAQGQAGGDLSGEYPAPSVVKLQGHALGKAQPTAGQVLTWSAADNTWMPQNLPPAPVTSVAGRQGTIVLDVSDIHGLGSAATYNVATSGTAGVDQVVLGGDPRLSDSRLPSGPAGGDLSGIYPNPTLVNKGTAGKYVKVETDAQGRVVSGSVALAPSDIPGLDWSQIVSGWPTTIAGYHITDAVINAGGTPSMQTGADAAKPQPGTPGRVYVATDAQKIYSDTGSTWQIVAGNQTSGGTVLSVSAGNGLLGGTITTSGTLSVNTGVGAGQIVQLDGSSRLPAVDGSQLTALNASNLTSGTVMPARLPAFTGDVTSAAGSVVLSVAKLQGVPLNAGAPGSGTYLKSDGSAWVPGSINMADLKSTVAGPLFNSPSCGSTQTLSWSPVTDQFSCIAIGISDASVTYRPQAANTFLAAPDGASGTPQFRAIVGADLPAGGYDGSYFKNGGNTFGAAAILGTADANDLKVVTGGQTRLTVGTGGNVGVGVAVPLARLDVGGEVKVGSSQGTCTSATAGSIRWNGTAFQGCDGKAWNPLATSVANASAPGFSYQINKTNAIYSATIPWGNAAPTKVSGTEILTATITPTSANSLIEVHALVHYSSRTGPYSSLTLAAFQNSAATAFATGASNITACSANLETSYLCQAALSTVFPAGSTSPIVIHVRAGQASGSWELNGSGGPILGGTLGSTLTVREILQ